MINVLTPTIGLDLGQSHDFSALALVESSVTPTPAPRRQRPGEMPWDYDKEVLNPQAVYQYAVRELRRWKLGTSYTDICEDVVELLQREKAGVRVLQGAHVAVDITGVGKPVFGDGTR